MSDKLRVWCQFTVKGKDGEVKLRIQDAPQDRLGDVAHLFAQHFATEETFHKISGLPENKEAIEEYEEIFVNLLKLGNVSICCVDEGPETTVGEIVGAGIMTLERKGDPGMDFTSLPTRTKEMMRFLKEILPLKPCNIYDIRKEMDLDTFYDDKGVVVRPDHRGLGIAQRMFNVRRLICKEEGVTMTGAWMTAFGSQKAAERDGWETVYEVPYEELEKTMKVTFKGTPPTCKFMITKP